MKNELRKNLTYKKTMLILSMLCIASGFLSSVLGEVMIPVASALLAAIILFENKEKRCYSYISASLLLLLNALMVFLPNRIISFWSIISIIFAIAISYGYSYAKAKSECAFLLTMIATLFLLLPLVLSAMISCGEYTISAALAYYQDTMATMREDFASYVNALINELSAAAGNSTVNADQFIALYDYQMSMLISYVVISAFALVGFTFKIFGAIVRRSAENTAYLSNWRFATDNVFAYFYFLLAIVSLFIGTPDTLFAVLTLNLYNIFMFVYFYIGFNVARKYFARGNRPAFATALLIICILMFSTYAIELLAVIGAFFTIKRNNENPFVED